MAVEVETSHIQICDANGDPVNGAKVYIYDVGTTTLKTVYSDTGLSVSVANPIVCDSAGRHAIRYIATGSYKYHVKTSADVSVFDAVDNVDGRVPVGSGALAIANGGTGSTTAGAALTALGGATAAELADVAADVASLSGQLASSEKTHIATGTTAQRPATPAEGDVRRNTTTTRWEGYVAAWQNFMTDNDLASQAQQEAGSSTAVFVTPGRQHFHPSAAKFWVKCGVAADVVVSHNVTSVADTATGRVTVTIATDFSGADWCAHATSMYGAVSARIVDAISQAAGTVLVRAYRASDDTEQDVDHYMISGYGDQA
jgi:hypothetical protein